MAKEVITTGSTSLCLDRGLPLRLGFADCALKLVLLDIDEELPPMNVKSSAPSIVDAAPLASPALASEQRDGKRGLIFFRTDRLLSYVILACGLCTIAVGATQIITSHSLVPLWDEWQEIDAIATAPHHQPPLSWLWSLHSEHRIAVYRLLLLADVHIFHGKQWIFFCGMLAVQCLFLASLVWMVRFAGIRGTLWRAIVGLGAFALFCPSQWENFGWGIQVSFLLPGLLAILALAALLKYERSIRLHSPKSAYLGLSIVAASVATYSSANGVIVWPLLLLVAIAFLPRLEVIAAYAGFGVALIGSYLYHYAGPSYHSSPLNSIRHPLSVLAYMAAYMGVIFPAWVKIRELLAIVSGTFGLLVAIAVTAWVLTRKRREPLHIALLGLTFYTLSSGFITALGRVGFGLAQAFSSRYQAFNLLFWFSIVGLVLLAVDEIKSSLRTLVLAAMAAVMLLAFVVFPLGLKASRTRTQQAEAAATALLAGVPDKEALGVLYIDPFLVWRDGEYFRQQHLFMFSDSKNPQMGQLLSSVYRMQSSQQCHGQVSVVEPVRPEDLLVDKEAGALRISGWAVDGGANSPVRRLVIAADGKIVGFAASIAGPFTAKHSELVRKSDSSEWLGYARPPREAALIDVYAVNKTADTICRLATAGVPPH
jgi:hypothetical protein